MLDLNHVASAGSHSVWVRVPTHTGKARKVGLGWPSVIAVGLPILPSKSAGTSKIEAGCRYRSSTNDADSWRVGSRLVVALALRSSAFAWYLASIQNRDIRGPMIVVRLSGRYGTSSEAIAPSCDRFHPCGKVLGRPSMRRAPRPELAHVL